MLSARKVSLWFALLALGLVLTARAYEQFEVEEVLMMADRDSSRGFNLAVASTSTGCSLECAADTGDQEGANQADDGTQARAPWEEPRNELGLFRLLETGFKQHYEKQYDNINELLVQQLPDNQDVAQNLAKVAELLEEERKRGVRLFKNRALVEALEQLARLGELYTDETKCTRKAYEILWKNNEAVRGLAQRPHSELVAPRRVESLVNKASTWHTIECFHVYPKRLAELRATMEPAKLRLVETFMDNLMGKCDCVRTPVRLVQGKRAAELAYELIERHSHQDPYRAYLGKVIDEAKGKLVVKAEGVRQLAERYLIEPCRAFVFHFGPDVFIPARFGSLALERADRYDESHGDFLHSWLHYRLCESLVRSTLR